MQPYLEKFQIISLHYFPILTKWRTTRASFKPLWWRTQSHPGRLLEKTAKSHVPSRGSNSGALLPKLPSDTHYGTHRRVISRMISSKPQLVLMIKNFQGHFAHAAEKGMGSRSAWMAFLGNLNLSPRKPGWGSRQASCSQVTTLILEENHYRSEGDRY